MSDWYELFSVVFEKDRLTALDTLEHYYDRYFSNSENALDDEMCELFEYVCEKQNITFDDIEKYIDSKKEDYSVSAIFGGNPEDYDREV